MIHCYECEFHDHDGASGYCNEFKTWTNMSFSCPDGKKEAKNSDVEKSQEEAKK